MTVICNSSPLIAFYSIDREDILRQLFSAIIIPEAVHGEVFTGRHKSDTLPDFITVGKVRDRNLVNLLEMQLDRGESEVIALAVEMNSRRVLIDDKPARQVADRLGLKVLGVAGVLILAKQKGIIVEVKPLILEIIDKINFRIDRKLLNKILLMVNESPD